MPCCTILFSSLVVVCEVFPWVKTADRATFKKGRLFELLPSMCRCLAKQRWRTPWSEMYSSRYKKSLESENFKTCTVSTVFHRKVHLKESACVHAFTRQCLAFLGHSTIRHHSHSRNPIRDWWSDRGAARDCERVRRQKCHWRRVGVG